jgi:hypothetical protein
MDTHKTIFELSTDIEDNLYKRLSPEIMRIINDVTNSNAALQENMKGIINASIAEWKVRLRHAIYMLYVMIGLVLVLSVYLISTRDKLETQVSLNHELIIYNRNLINDNSRILYERQYTIDDIYEKLDAIQNMLNLQE